MKTAIPVRHLLTLSVRDGLDLVTATVLLPLFWLGLRWLGLERWRRLLLRTSATARQRAQRDPRSVSQLVNAAARHSWFHTTCLTRSLLLEWMLRRRGIGAKLCIGVQLHDSGIKAHAWVECGGVPVNEKPGIASEFAPFADLVPASSSLHFQ